MRSAVLFLFSFTLISLVSEKARAQEPVVDRLLVVGPPKIYDDLYLRSQLAALQNQLALIHGVDQTTLLSHIGVAQGADLRQSSVALSASGPPTPQSSTFSLAPGVPAFSYPPGYTGSSSAAAYPLGTATTTTPGTTTTVGPMTPSAPAPPAPALPAPSISSLGQSSLDTYNESLQLSSEIASTALLLNGAVSDTLQLDGKPKTTLTVGFPITVDPPSRTDRDLENAVAEVRVKICSASTGEPPSIVTLLPRERTYNVASLVDKSFLGSVSAILGGFVNVGGSFLWSHKTYYLVQQQETVALLRGPGNCSDPNNRSATFAWQIHPVLGKKFIRPGNSVNFVQVSVPQVVATSASTEKIGEACVAVLWHKGDNKGQYFTGNVPSANGKAGSSERCYPIEYYNTLQPDTVVTVTDIGQGAVQVAAHGTFLPGSTVRLGNAFLNPATITATHETLTFSAPANAIVAAGEVTIVGRDSREVDLVHHPDPLPPQRLSVDAIEITPYSDTQLLLNIRYTPPIEKTPGVHGPNPKNNPAIDPWVVVIGGKVFGLSDSPFLSSDEHQIKLLVPATLLQSSLTVEVRRLLWPDSFFRDSRTISSDLFPKRAPSISKATILSTHNGLTLGLTGSDLDNLELVFPSETDCKRCTAVALGSTFMKVTLPKPQPAKPATTHSKAKKRVKSQDKTATEADPTDGLKELVFCQKARPALPAAGGRACDPAFPRLILDIPKLDSPAPKPSLDQHGPVASNTRQVTLTGSMLDQVISIEHAKTTLNFRLNPGDTSSLLLDVPDAMAAVPGGYSLLVTLADKSTLGYLLTIQNPAN